ncbi:MAG: hypothetical protein AB7O59_19370 [Pirellulales bacterium]
MFSLHDSTRTVLCRAVFVALCLAPTGGIAAWCVAVRLPQYHVAHEASLSDQSGWTAHLSHVTTPRPGLVLYEGLQLSDPASGQLLARLPAVEVDRQSAGTDIRLAQPATINGMRLDALFDSARRMLRAVGDNQTLSLAAQHVTLHLPDGDQTIANATGHLEADADGARLLVAFRPAGANGNAPTAAQPAMLEVMVSRQRSDDPRCVVRLNSGETPLPSSLIAGSWPTARRLGRACTFTGRITATEKRAGWTLELVGQLRGIDLAQLMESYPHALSGSAELQLEQARIENGRLVSASGTLTAGPGTISRSLIQAARDHLRLDVDRQTFVGRENQLSYRRLHVAFTIDDKGLSLVGDSSSVAGAILADDRRVLVRQTSNQRQPVVNLLRTLVPQSAVQVPATRESAPLAAFLPVPPIMPPPGSEAPLPQARGIRVSPQ